MGWRKSRGAVPLPSKIQIAYEVLLEEDEDMSTEMLFARIGDLTGARDEEIVAVLVDMGVNGSA